MKYPTIRLVFDRKKLATDKKKGLIQVEVLHLRQRKYFSSGVKVYPSQWNDKKMVVSRPDSEELNTILSNMVSSIRKYIISIQEKNIPFNFNDLDIYLNNNTNNHGSFIDFYYDRIQSRKLEESTRAQHMVTYNKVVSFGKIKSFSDLTLPAIKAFDDYIKSESDKVQSTVHSVHKRLKPYVRDAYELGYIKENPYAKFSVPIGKSTLRKYLDFEEMKKLESAEISDLAIDRARDCFVFCCYTGLSYSDLEKFNFETDTIEANGKHFIQDERTKTGSEYRIQILSPAMKILQKYDYRLPVISNQKYNQYLKLVAKYAGIQKPLTSHMARHTFAVFALNNGVRIEVVSKMLAHSDIKTTQIYAKILQKEVEDGFDILEKKLR